MNREKKRFPGGESALRLVLGTLAVDGDGDLQNGVEQFQASQDNIIDVLHIVQMEQLLEVCQLFCMLPIQFRKIKVYLMEEKTGGQ